MAINHPKTPFYYKYVCKIAAVFRGGGGIGGHLWVYPKSHSPYCERCGKVWEITRKPLPKPEPEPEINPCFEDTRPICLGCMRLLDFDEICNCESSGRFRISDEDKSDEYISGRFEAVTPSAEVVFEVDDDYLIEVKARDGILEGSLLAALEEGLKDQGYEVKRLAQRF